MSALAADVALVVQAGIVLAVVEGLRRRHVPAVVNGVLAFGATLLPAAWGWLVVDPGGPVPAGAELTLWLAAAGFLHAAGMLGLYDALWWWDHLTHGVSAALVTALAYAGALVVEGAGLLGPLAPLGALGLTLALLLVFSVLWELLEELARFYASHHEIRPLLVIYGPYDAAFDLAFNLVGAAVVLALDLRLFVPVFEPHPLATAGVLGWLGGLALLAALGVTALMALVRDDWP